MIQGLGIVLQCPFCGGRKEVMNVIGGDISDAEVWSDGRCVYPMCPDVSPVQMCPYCGKYYFLDEAREDYSRDSGSMERSFGQLGKLTYRQMKEAKAQMASRQLTPDQRWKLNHQFFMAYNDVFRRDYYTYITGAVPHEEDIDLFNDAVAEMLNCFEGPDDSVLLHAEILREVGRFDEAKEVMSHVGSHDNPRYIGLMLGNIEAKNTEPFMFEIPVNPPEFNPGPPEELF